MDSSGKLWIREGDLIVEVGGGGNPFDRVAVTSNNGVGDDTFDAGDGDYQTAGWKSRSFGAGLNTPDGLKKFRVHAVMNLSKTVNNGLVTVKMYMGQVGDKTDDIVYRAEEHHANARPDFQINMEVVLTPLSGDLYSFSFATGSNSAVIRAGDTAGWYCFVTSQLIE